MKKIILFSIVLVAGLVILVSVAKNKNSDPSPQIASVEFSGDNALATFAGGCFWCVETPFEKLPGVKAVISGYSGGNEKNPTYRQVSAGLTGHTESVQIHYDPRVITYEDLLEVFWRQINPTDLGGQFVDRGV